MNTNESIETRVRKLEERVSEWESEKGRERPDRRIGKQGEVWVNDDDPYIIANTQPWVYQFISLDDGNRWSDKGYQGAVGINHIPIEDLEGTEVSQFIFAARSVREYYRSQLSQQSKESEYGVPFELYDRP